MSQADLNLLRALEALLSEGSVAGAARRLGLSASAMSRTLARLRQTTGDGLLVRAGRGMVLTPHAAALRETVAQVTEAAGAVLGRAPASLDLGTLDRVFTLRANEGFLASFAAQLVSRVTAAAPGVQLRFSPKPDKAVRPLREGLVDLEIGVLGEGGSELKIQTLFRDHFVGVVRTGHPLIAAPVTAESYAACGHVVASRRGQARGPVDEALAALGLVRKTVVVVPGFPAALAIAAASDLVALAPRSFARAEIARSPVAGAAALQLFTLPVQTEEITVSQMWHPRMDADPAHQWLRSVVKSCCRLAAEPDPDGDTPGRP